MQEFELEHSLQLLKQAIHDPELSPKYCGGQLSSHRLFKGFKKLLVVHAVHVFESVHVLHVVGQAVHDPELR